MNLVLNVFAKLKKSLAGHFNIIFLSIKKDDFEIDLYIHPGISQCTTILNHNIFDVFEYKKGRS